VPTIAATQIATASPTATYTPEDHLSPLSCTAFRLLDSSGRPIIGSASDTGDDIWAGGCSLFVNKRNVAKTGVDLIPDQQPATWISKYGSVAFGKFGREFPSEGVNEAGLVIKVLALIDFEQVKPLAPDSRPYVFGNFQWAQYQLDNSSTVQEVIESNSIIRPAALYFMDYLTHFWVSDRNGDCAVIEFLDGEMVCHSTTGEQNMPYKSITNATYEDSVSYLSQFEGFGGNDPIPDESADDKLSRFVQSVYWVQEYSGDSDPIDYAFDALDYVGQTGDVATRQKLVYDLQNLRVYFRTPENLNIRYVDLDSFDFSCETPVTMLDIKANLSGDVSGDFIVYDPEPNYRQVENFCNYAFFENPPEGLVDTISQYPESTYCSGQILSAFAGAYGSISLDPNYISLFDFDGDEDVDGSDLALLAAAFEYFGSS
jgi:penicillin V acylase-like amidase (Ntn superfamily)